MAEDTVGGVERLAADTIGATGGLAGSVLGGVGEVVEHIGENLRETAVAAKRLITPRTKR